MKIIHLSTYDSNGGAARAAYRLHTGLNRLGYDSSMVVRHQSNDDPTVIAFEPPVRLEIPMDIPSRLRRRLRRELTHLRRRLGLDPPPPRRLENYQATCPAGYDFFSDDRCWRGTSLPSQLPASDIINLHWISNFLDYRSFFTVVPEHTPVVWTLHDMNAFTGGCHYDDGCRKYTERCGTCPQLGSTEENDLSRQIWQRKQNTLDRVKVENLHIVTDSYWLAAEAKRGSLLSKFPITTIHYGLDTDYFAPRDRFLARDVLGVPQSAKVVLFVADSITNRRKGFGLLSQALAKLHDVDDLFLLSLGHNNPEIDIQVPALHLGHIAAHDRLLSLIYSAADVFVIPSLQEAFGQTALESIACGTPVVGFEVGGVPEIVRPHITGLLAPAEDVSALRQAITQLLQDSTMRAELSANCRRIAVQEYALEIQARRYVELYETILVRQKVPNRLLY